MITNVLPSKYIPWLESLTAECAYAGLHTATPDFGNPSATEVGYSGYSRQRALWSAAVSDGSVRVVDKPLRYTGVRKGLMISHVALYGSVTGSDLIAYGKLDKPVSVTSAALTIPANTIAVVIA